eukprot:TRINITY_DN81069_c0_g1_i1.p1 TRINITY_DN81069_c0_g1~~TRINITY_DN81069_c0_g1_i1.p1  ORF type:complete len:684 (+),score=181.23 TRINITY_DN81069_c0_g1_i1:161-2212(+)
MSEGFEGIGCEMELCAAAQEAGWLYPTPVQAEAIPLILGGGDLMVAAETGSGKTAAFSFPTVQLIAEQKRQQIPKKQELSGFDRDSDISIKGGLCQNASDRWGGVRGTLGARKGSYYYEATLRKGLARFGFGNATCNLNLGTDANGYGYGLTAMKSNNRDFVPYGEKFGDGDVIGCFIDIDRQRMYFAKNGVVFEDAFTGSQMIRDTYFPVICMRAGESEINFGETDFKYKMPPGFKPVTAMREMKQLKNGTMAIVVEPTRDLARQTYEAILDSARFFDEPRVSVELCTGGEPRKGKVRANIVVGTLPMMCSLARKGDLSLGSVNFFILDEADAMCEEEDLRKISELHRKMPKHGVQRLQVCFFSATLHSPAITTLSEMICENPTWVDLKGKDFVPEQVNQLFVDVSPEYPVLGGRLFLDQVHTGSSEKRTPEGRSQLIKSIKMQALPRLIEKLKMEQVMVFCRTNVDCDNMEKYLRGQLPGRVLGVTAGQRSNEDRKRSIAGFKNGDIHILISTDASARGIDIEGLPYVVNMTLPDDPDMYVHRVGRVGRAECSGLAISLVATEKEKVWYHANCKNRRTCQNRNLLDEGGCTIWYDEPELEKGIMKRLKITEKIPRMNLTTLQLPKEVASKKFGEVSDKWSAMTERTRNQLSNLRPLIDHLTGLEQDVQRSSLLLAHGIVDE